MLKFIALVTAIAFAACGTLGTNTNKAPDQGDCKRITYCMIGYHHPPGNDCACVPD